MNIPTGTVTFLFTEIDERAKLSHEFPDTMTLILQNYNSIITQAVEFNNGFIFKIMGDAFCCAFENVSDAFTASYEIQKKIFKTNRDVAAIKVRMGIHSGNAEWNGTDYMGYITLARTHRVMAASYGGQILISNDAYENARKKSEKEISFRDLGERLLKDLIQPMKLYQLVSPEFPSDFPPLKTLDARPNNLPIQLTSFIGREKELSDVKKILSDARLLTLLGPGGTGKTRLALQTGADLIDDFTNGVWLIELASILDPFLLTHAIAEAVEVKEQPGQSLEEILIDFLRNKEILLIMDNCEHLIDACAKLAEKLLKNSPKLKIITTSREALRCDGETTYKVLSLKHPSPEEKVTIIQLSQYEAVRLFIERALTVNPNFRVTNQNAPALAQICFQLDGIPLAIELAAVRIKVLPVEKICEKLSDRFKLLTGGKRTALPRQQTLKALIDWSYDLLSVKEQILWRRLSVFAGGWTLADAEGVCADELLEQEDVFELINELTGKSIILYLDNIGKFKMLETIRQYGEQRLIESNETEKFYTKHLKYYLNLCEGAIPEFTGPKAKFWLDKFEEEYPNIQKALKWSVDKNLKEEGNRLAVSMGKLWDLRGYFSEGRNWLQKLLNDPGNLAEEVIANSKRLAGLLATQQGQNDVAIKYTEESLEIYRRLENKTGIANSLNVLGLIAYDLGEYKKSKIYLNESLSLRREMKIPVGICSTLNSLGLVFMIEGDFVTAKKKFEESLEIAIEIKDDMYIGIGYNNLAEVYDHLGDYEKSKQYFEYTVKLDREFGNKNGLCSSLTNLGLLYFKNNDFENAKKLYKESLAMSKELGFLQGILYSLTGQGQIAIEEGDFINAENIFIECLNYQKDYSEIKCAILSLLGIAEIKSIQGNHETAVKLVSVAKEKRDSTGAFIDKDLDDRFQKILNDAIKNIGEEKTYESIALGKSMSFEEAIKIINNK